MQFKRHISVKLVDILKCTQFPQVLLMNGIHLFSCYAETFELYASVRVCRADLRIEKNDQGQVSGASQ